MSQYLPTDVKGLVGLALALILVHKILALVTLPYCAVNDPRREYEIVENLIVSLAGWPFGVVIHLAVRLHVSQEAHTNTLAAFWLAM